MFSQIVTVQGMNYHVQYTHDADHDQPISFESVRIADIDYTPVGPDITLALENVFTPNCSVLTAIHLTIQKEHPSCKLVN